MLLAAGLLVGAGVLLATRPPDLPVANVRLDGGSTTEAPVPWREPDADRRRFFPTADGAREETRVLSGEWRVLRERLGRAPTGDDFALRLQRVTHQSHRLGAVFLRRVRGDAGAVEVVVALDEEARLVGLRVQRQREEPATARVLARDDWWAAARGHGPSAPWPESSETDPEARPLVAAILAAARECAILWEVARAAEPAGEHH